MRATRPSSLPVRRSDLCSARGELLESCPSLARVFTFGPRELGEDLLSLAAGISAGPLAPGPNEPDDTSWLLYTGGTTGVPKAAELPESAVAQMALSVSIGWDLPDSGVTSPARRSRTRRAC